MAAPIDFYFDFASPYGYLAAEKIEPLAAKHGRSVTWRPTLLGAVFKITGGKPLPEWPLKGEYAKRDFLRSARFHDVAFKLPSAFPVGTVSACRAFYASPKDKQVALARALYRAYFVENINIGETGNVLKVASTLGLEPDLNDQAIKDKTKAEVEASIGHGVFGSPYFIVDNEPFWGIDRFDQLERWLQKPF
ncbi:MAG TPA: 2-hydroxychromene-2-carboxylate isomerase [Burkholderiales bacterium]|nr:2-hydroxychromene-2-carboxylate isomerase [Burkholderiales bacterium]